MSELVVVSFADRFQAEVVLLDLLRLEQEHLVVLDDAVVVIKKADGKIRVKAYHDLVKPIPDFGNELWGGMISAVVFHRSLEIAEGFFDSHFLIEVEDSLQPNTSALFVMVDAIDADPVLAAMAGVGGKVIRTTLPAAAREKLQAALQSGRSMISDK